MNLKEITRVTPTPNEEEMSMLDKTRNNIKLNHRLLLRQTLGQITLEHKGKAIRVFRDLTEKEKLGLIAEIEKAIKNGHQ